MSTDFKIESGNHYVTGIPGIDSQHKEFFLMLDGFLNSLKSEKLSPEIVRAAIQQIFEHLRSHLFTEESLMEMVDFPKVADHKAQHRNFINLFNEEIKALKDVDNPGIIRFVRSYRHIALTHINVFDREYVEFIENIMSVKKRFSIIDLRAEQATAG